MPAPFTRRRTVTIRSANRLLAALPVGERAALMSLAETVELRFGDVLCEPDESYRHVYFPLAGFISLLSRIDGHPPLEMGLIGSEGMLGATLLLGVPTVPFRALVQGPGSALRIAAAPFRKIIAGSPALDRILRQHVYLLLMQLGQTAACTRFHDVGHRLARWLLMTHDRAGGDHFKLTHQFLADMLGVRRSGITTAAGVMQEAGLIRYVRGDIEVLDRSGLEQASCSCYVKVQAGNR
ncbi:MAG: Crp/Fnr family transcriptional regulator [Gammaproteobacteria bacterium]|nr:Crp/Fnr family transcriptional regulator [Gammaproteobacteria bacterium]